VTEAEVLEAARGLRLWPLLGRLSRAGPRPTWVRWPTIAVRLGALMLADESLEEIEINPVLVRETAPWRWMH
jgi:acetate---CoA ligase (ADP-forming)